MSDTFKIDSHKLIYHPIRTSDWLQGKNIYPLYMELSPSGRCNHRCTFCGMDHIGYPNRFLNTPIMKKRLTEMGALGVKSIMFAGEGEPLLHPDILELSQTAVKAGIDISFTTNGVLLNEKKLQTLLPITSWIKVSWNAGSPESYASIHRTKKSDYDTVKSNLLKAISLRKKHGYSCTIGAQMILLPNNIHEVEQHIQTCKDIGLDYLVIKPYSQNPRSLTEVYKDYKYENLEDLQAIVQQYNTENFSVVFRISGMEKRNEGVPEYKRCLAIPFWSYLDSAANLWACLDHAGNSDFSLGNLHNTSFQEIWEGEDRQRVMKWIEKSWDCTNCRSNCRVDEINKYLHKLKSPDSHVNFI